MYKNVMKVAVVVAIAMVAGINLLNAQKPEVLSDIAMANVEALADYEGDYGCAGNPTWIKDQALQSATCWNGGSHKVCREMGGVCCDPSMMTDCAPVIHGLSL